MIVIKNMDMPANCFECRFEHMGWCGACEGNLPKVQSLDRPHWCPLVEITNLEISVAEAVYPTVVCKTALVEPLHRNPEDAHREDFGGASHE